MGLRFLGHVFNLGGGGAVVGWSHTGAIPEFASCWHVRYVNVTPAGQLHLGEAQYFILVQLSFVLSEGPRAIARYSHVLPNLSF